MVRREVIGMTAQLPVTRFRAGQVSWAVWENEIKVDGQSKVMLKATVHRRYKDKNGEWQSSSSFSRNEILWAVYCLQKAFDAIVTKERLESREDAPAMPALR